MTRLQRLKLQLRERAEHHLRLAAMRRLGAGRVPGTVAPYEPPGDRVWRRLFVPLYLRVPWSAKQRAMRMARMTARGWAPPERRPSEPWRPPAPRP